MQQGHAAAAAPAFAHMESLVLSQAIAPRRMTAARRIVDSAHTEWTPLVPTEPAIGAFRVKVVAAGESPQAIADLILRKTNRATRLRLEILWSKAHHGNTGDYFFRGGLNLLRFRLLLLSFQLREEGSEERQR